VTGLPPNIEGGTPAPAGYVKVRYAPRGKRYWIEPFIHAAARQSRLSTLDLDDRRTGASRSRTSIRTFFINGATARGYVNAGPDNVLGTADDRLTVTGETVADIQNRVLGSANASSLWTSVPGFVTVNARGGVRLGAHHDLLVAFENIGDGNYRGISWGVDAPGRNLYASYRLTF
jgi:hemoglobin/transferrin/lactoferrin receptor protein